LLSIQRTYSELAKGSSILAGGISAGTVQENLKRMEQDNLNRLSTGIPGLDDILHGGLAKGFLYLIEGHPGAGKTTLALQFLMEGARQGETGLYISLAESESELRRVAESHGFNLDKITLCKVSPPELKVTNGKIVIGRPLSEFAGVLAGSPQYQGGQPLL
jgi:predicted ATP-dependent serine protease